MMYGKAVSERVRSARFMGELRGAAESSGSNPVCGDILKLALLFEDDRIRDARWQAQGCPPTLAAADVLVEMIVGEPIASARNITADEVAARLPGMPRTSFHAAQLAVQVLRSALDAAGGGTGS